VLAALARSAVRDVHILIRRGPADVKFTPAELFQLSELAETDVTVHDGGDGIGDPALAQDKRVRLNLKTLRAFAETRHVAAAAVSTSGSSARRRKSSVGTVSTASSLSAPAGRRATGWSTPARDSSCQLAWW
jgi:hypothetical protein